MSHRIDYLGTALLVGAVGSILLAVTWGGTQYAWGSTIIIALGVGGAILLAAFISVERRVAEPVLPPYLFRNRVFTVATATMFIVGLAMFGGIIYLPLFLQVVGGRSATNAGLLLLPLILGIMFTAIVSGRVISRTGRYKAFPVTGMLVMAFGMYLLSTMGPTTGEVSAGCTWWCSAWASAWSCRCWCWRCRTRSTRATWAPRPGRRRSCARWAARSAWRCSARCSRTAWRRTWPNCSPAGTCRPASRTDTLQGQPAGDPRLAAGVRAPVIEAFAKSIDTVFLVGVPIAIAGFGITLLLREVPLRSSGPTPVDRPAARRPSRPSRPSRS